MKLLEGKTAIITGGSRGIGKGIAMVFAQHGANVAFTYSSSVESANSLEKELSNCGVKVKSYQSNAADHKESQDLVENILTDFGSIDILVNNAGITRDNISMRLKDEDWDDVMQVNLKAAFNLTQGVMRGMMKNRWGRIINITSVVGVTGNPGQVNYAASKAGMIGMSKSFAHELASRNITVNCVAPGFIESPMTDNLTEDQKIALLTNVPAGRLGKGNEIAASVLYLASPESAYITGQTLHINGGMAMI